MDTMVGNDEGNQGYRFEKLLEEFEEFETEDWRNLGWRGIERVRGKISL